MFQLFVYQLFICFWSFYALRGHWSKLEIKQYENQMALEFNPPYERGSACISKSICI